ncbi:putative quinol monooxygenase [Natrialba asiatica]|uniref:Antibiotic biosynthesis monooxygenase n=1 Tax=Natrialba asiatica (strain ATCC 700177 / DSM 12278 / JCM 9576 / FERM P-10747 / NBRC 102637 / 172P1) TaxID=29540 RepID=M0B5L9_NATA1|nr:antibiotic biosynthesis monooxygenase family protein [Natrialba asiatica]ELZ04944.1 Antibiotic biosynthesis monooxygenase [Natrialba asiatica DSM 12278]
MIIISGKVYVDTKVRDEWVAQHQEMVARARKQPGCLDLVIAADPLEENRYNIYEAWESEEHLDEWRKVANPPESQFDPERVEVQKYQVSESGPPL